MILTTTQQIEGHTIREYKGVVTGETIIGANFVKDFFAGIRDIVGGRSSSSCLGKRPEVERREGAARSKGHFDEGDDGTRPGYGSPLELCSLPTGRKNAIVGIDIDYETIGETNSMLMVATSGTAVVI